MDGPDGATTSATMAALTRMRPDETYAPYNGFIIVFAVGGQRGLLPFQCLVVR